METTRHVWHLLIWSILTNQSIEMKWWWWSNRCMSRSSSSSSSSSLHSWSRFLSNNSQPRSLPRSYRDASSLIVNLEYLVMVFMIVFLAIFIFGAYYIDAHPFGHANHHDDHEAHTYRYILTIILSVHLLYFTHNTFWWFTFLSSHFSFFSCLYWVYD